MFARSRSSASNEMNKAHTAPGDTLSSWSTRTTTRVSLTALLGTPVTDAQGHLRGRLKDIAVATGRRCGQRGGPGAQDAHRPVHRALAGGDGDARRHARTALGRRDGPAQGSGQLPLSATGPDRPPDHRYSRPQGGPRQRRRTGVDGPGRGSPAARGRGRGGPARSLSPRLQGNVCRAPAWRSSRANSAPAAFPGSLST